MQLLLLAVVALLFGGLAALWRERVGPVTTVAGCVIGLVGAVHVLWTGATVSLKLPWAVPFGSFYVEADALSAFFLLPILGLSALAAIYGSEYLTPWRGKKSLGASWFFFNLLVASMVMVVLARNGVLFLVVWEVMALASFFLVTFEDERDDVRAAGWTYLVATHLGTAFLLAMFVLLGCEKGSLDFDRFTTGKAGLVFVLALIGFGTKAGFWPLHVWLPEAHPAAPSHVSALMSGVMIKTGIYGLLRVLTFLGPPPVWWGWVLVGVGLSSGILGVVFALAQHDLKRLLAYHSVENIGIIVLGIGVGLLGMSAGLPVLAALGFAGALLHVVNHALFKGLLFLGAGAVLHETGTRDIEHLGGLLKRMPATAATFLIGAIAISGLPPLNGFISEFLIYLGAFKGGVTANAAIAVPLLAVITGLALIGGLAAACFTKAFGVVFLGEPRSEHADHAHEPGPAMRAPMLLLAAGCVAIGMLSPLTLGVLAPVVSALTPAETLWDAARPLVFVSGAGIVAMVLIGIVAVVRRPLLARRHVGETGTWDCGYAAPTARMQYTGSSFAQPLTELFRPLLGTRKKFTPPTGYFPETGALTTDTPDVSREKVYRPTFALVEAGLGRLRWLQHGNVQLYVLYIALTLLVLLVWKLS